MKQIHVIAQGDGTVPYVDELGRHHPARAVGRAADGTPAAERVADTSYVRRAIGRGDLAIVEGPTAKAAQAAAQVDDSAPPAPAPSAVTTDAPLVIQRGIAANPLVNRTEP